MTDLSSGILLLSDPFLKDPNFIRSVIFLCDYTAENGAFGFVVNKTFDHEIGDLIEGAEGIHFPVYEGGPVQKHTLHFLHQRPDMVTGGQEITSGIFWGGDFSLVLELLREDRLTKTDIRFFLGYSGWDQGQLEGEIKEKSWIARPANAKLVFTPSQDIPQLWKTALKELGGEYGQMVNYPIDPQLN